MMMMMMMNKIGEKEAWKYFEEFIDGFVEHGRLTPVEINAIPDLINLRILSNVRGHCY